MNPGEESGHRPDYEDLVCGEILGRYLARRSENAKIWISRNTIVKNNTNLLVKQRLGACETPIQKAFKTNGTLTLFEPKSG